LSQRHDILLGEGKITGIAQYRTKDKCLTHGTVLVSADLEALADLLRPDCEVPLSSGRPSVRSKVTNVTAHRPELTIAEVQAALIQAFTAAHGPVSPLMLTSAAWAEIREAARTKYGSWDWTIGRSPVFSIRRRTDFKWGRCEALVDIQRGRMVRVAFTLPDGAPPALGRLAEHLEGARYQPETVARRVCSGAAALNLAVDRRMLTEWLCPSWVWGH
jgi:lipoate-protein ligase A